MAELPLTYDLSCTQGDNFEKAFRLRDADTQAIYDLTGWVGKAQMRTAANAFLAEFVVTINQAVAAGVVLLELDDTVTEPLEVGTHKYDLELVNAAGKRITYLGGEFKIKPQVTKATQ